MAGMSSLAISVQSIAVITTTISFASPILPTTITNFPYTFSFSFLFPDSSVLSNTSAVLSRPSLQSLTISVLPCTFSVPSSLPTCATSTSWPSSAANTM